MATKLFLRETTSQPGAAYRAMLPTAGPALTTGIVTATASGTEIQWTKTAGGALLQWLSPPAPVGGFTLAGLMTFNLWARESANTVNAGCRARVFKWAAGVETEVLGGPWSAGVEMSTGMLVRNWTGTPTSTAIAADERLVVKFYVTNIGTMAAGTATMDYNGPTGAADGDAWFQTNETVAWKPEPIFPPRPAPFSPLLCQ